MSSSILLLIGFLIIIALALTRSPIWIALFIGTVFIQVFVNKLPLTGIFLTMTEGLAKTSIMCIPFFILTGTIVEHSTLGARLVDFCVLALRKVKGGLAVAILVANGFFGAVSGSSGAAAVLFGKITYKPLKENYDEQTSLGLLTSSSVLSAIIPPSMTMIMFCIATSTSIMRLFMAGFLPGIIIIAVVFIYLKISIGKKIKTGKFISSELASVTSVKDLTLGRAFWRAMPIFVLPVIIFGGIYGGIFTPTEAGAVSSIYCIIISLIMRDINTKGMITVLKSTMQTCAFTMILIATSVAFAQAITIAQVMQRIESLFATTNIYMYLLLLNLILLIAGCFIDGVAAILILAPIFVPVGISLGLSAIHLGIVFTVNISLGCFTPPFGMSIFTIQGVTGAKYGNIVRSLIPYIIIYLSMTLLITYIPGISLLLPSLLT